MPVHFFKQKEMLERMNKHRRVREKHVYIHFKGGYYFVETLGFESEKGVPVVVYRSLDTMAVWVRPLQEFLDIKETEKGYTNRFTLCEF